MDFQSSTTPSNGWHLILLSIQFGQMYMFSMPNTISSTSSAQLIVMFFFKLNALSIVIQRHCAVYLT